MFPQHDDLFLIRSPCIFGITVYGDPWSFQDLRNIREIRMMYDAVQGVKADASLSKILMPVFGGAAGIFTVVDMEDGDLIFSQDRKSVV